MLTLLDLLNRFLGYFNIQDKAKGKAFTVVAALANFYILYLAIRSLRYAGYRVQGALLLAVFLVLLYFIVLNVLYYFTNKTTKFDISPRVEKLLGGNPERMKAAEAALAKQGVGAASGVFAQQELLPTTLITTPQEEANLKQLVQQLLANGTLTTNYQGLDAHAVLRVAQKTHQPVAAIGGPFELPYYRLAIAGDQVQVLGGLNALNAVPLAEVTQVGLMPVKAALKDYQLAAGHVFLQGGERQRPGRHGLIKETQPYEILVQIAYSPRPDVTGNEK